MPIIVVNEKPNITHLTYADGKRKGVFSFRPGQNTIEAEIWAAVKKEAGKSLAHFRLKAVNEEAPEQAIDFAKLPADDAIALAGGAMDLALLDGYAQAEAGRKGGSRKTVLEAIDRQRAEIQAIEDKKKAAK